MEAPLFTAFALHNSVTERLIVVMVKMKLTVRLLLILPALSSNALKVVS